MVVPQKPFKSKELKDKLVSLIDPIRQGSIEAREEFASLLIPYLRKRVTKLNISSYDLNSSINWSLTKILNNIDKLDSQKNILSYISNAVKNFCIDEYRKISCRKRRQERLQLPTSYVDNNQSIESMIEDLSEDEEERVILSKIVLDRDDIDTVSKDLKISKLSISKLLNRVKQQLTVQ